MALRLAMLASGRGSNVQAVIDAVADGHLDAQIAGVFSDRPEALALTRARNAGMAAHALSPTAFASRAAFDRALFARVDACAPDIIVCAGYMRIIGADEVAPRFGRILNIHPSLLPRFKGLHTHAQALAAGVAEHGASVHYVSAELDGGPVIAQARVPVLAGDTPARLAARVLEREHPLLLAVLRWLSAGRIALKDGRVYADGRALAAPLVLDTSGGLG